MVFLAGQMAAGVKLPKGKVVPQGKWVGGVRLGGKKTGVSRLVASSPAASSSTEPKKPMTKKLNLKVNQKEEVEEFKKRLQERKKGTRKSKGEPSKKNEQKTRTRRTGTFRRRSAATVVKQRP